MSAGPGFIPQVWAQQLERRLWNQLSSEINWRYHYTWVWERNDLIQKLKLQRRRRAHYTRFYGFYYGKSEAINIPEI